MTKHNYKNNLHCPTCFDKSIKRMLKWDRENNMQPPKIILSPTQYKACQKYGYPEGLLRITEFERT